MQMLSPLNSIFMIWFGTIYQLFVSVNHLVCNSTEFDMYVVMNEDFSMTDVYWMGDAVNELPLCILL